MKTMVMLTLLLCMVSVSVGQAQQTGSQTAAPLANSQKAQVPSGWILYDDFRRPWLDPTKWAATPGWMGACFFSSNVLECVREIQGGKLRLAVKNYGATDSDEGTQYGESKIVFTQPFKGVTADIVVRSTSSRGCPTSTTNSFAQATFSARFFNSGSGNPNDDVDANIGFLQNSLDDPGMIGMWGQMIWQGQGLGFVWLGQVPLGTPVRTTLLWNRPSHKFTISFKNLITKETFGADMPYTMPDMMPPTGYWDVLYAQAFPANCTSQHTSSQMEATFDNVVINR